VGTRRIGGIVRFISFRLRNTDPSIPAFWIEYPMAVLEDGYCSRQEELLRSEGLICDQEWDKNPAWGPEKLEASS
jgi:hypothetical protein